MELIVIVWVVSGCGRLHFMRSRHLDALPFFSWHSFEMEDVHWFKVDDNGIRTFDPLTGDNIEWRWDWAAFHQIRYRNGLPFRLIESNVWSLLIHPPMNTHAITSAAHPAFRLHPLKNSRIVGCLPVETGYRIGHR